MLSRLGFNGPYFFEKGNRAITVDAECSVAMIENLIVPIDMGIRKRIFAVANHTDSIKIFQILKSMCPLARKTTSVWFQQDGVKARLLMRRMRANNFQ